MASTTLVLQGGAPALQPGASAIPTSPQAGTSLNLGPSGNPSILSSSSPSLSVDPTSTFDSDTQTRLKYATEQGVPYDQAEQAAIHYQNTKNKAVPEQPEQSGIKGLLANSKSFLNTTNIGSTLGMVGADALGAILAPETGGLSLIAALALNSAAAAGGGAIGEEVRSKLGGDNIDVGKAAESGAIAGAGGKLLGYGIKAVGSAMGGRLSDAAEKLGLGALGITKGQSTAFGVQTGKSLGEFLTENGLIGKNAEAVTAAREAAQASYDAIARQSGIQVPVSDLTEHIAKQVAPLHAGVSSESKAAAQSVIEEYQAALKNMGVDLNDPNAAVDIGKLADAKSEYQRQVNWKNPDNINTIKGSLSSALLQTVNDAADKAGLTDASGNSLSQIGKKLQGLNLVDQWAQKAANTTGTQKTPWTLGNLLRPAASTVIGTGIGGPVGGAIGAAAGLASDVVASSPKIIGATAALEKGASNIIPAIANSPATALATDAGTQVLGHTIANESNPVSMSATPDLSANPQNQPNQAGQGSVPSSPNLAPTDLAMEGVAALKSGQPITQSQYQAMLEKDLVSTGGRFQSQITAAYNAGNPTAVQGLGIAANAANTLQDLYQKAGGAAGPISGGISTALGNTGLTAKSVKAYNDQKLALGQEIVSQIYGSAGTASDRDQVLNLIPAISDPPEVAASKMATLRSLIQQRLSSMTSSTPTSVTSLNTPSLNLNQ